MQRMTLRGLPISEATRKTLENTAGIAGALVGYGPEPDQNTQVHVFGPGCFLKTLERAQALVPGAVYFWERDWKPARRKVVAKPRTDGLSRTAAALKLIDTEEVTPYSAAQQCGVDVAAVYRALARREARAKAPKCQCCGRPLHAPQGVAA